MQAQFNSIADDLANDLARVCEIASLRFNRVVKAKLDEWAERFPRHSFKAWEGHGLMSIDVTPAIGGGDYGIQLMSPKDYRGAVAEVIADAVAIVDAFNAMETRVCLYCDEYDTAKKDA